MEELDHFIHSLGEKKKKIRKASILESQLKIIRALKEPMKARDLYRKLHLRSDEFWSLVNPLIKKKILKTDGSTLYPGYASPEEILPFFQKKVQRLELLEKTVYSLPAKIFLPAFILLAFSFGVFAIYQSVSEAPPMLRGASPVADPECRGFSLDFGDSEGIGEIEISRDGKILGSGSFYFSGKAHFCKQKNGFSLAGSDELIQASLDDFLLFDITIKDIGSSEVLVPDFREENLVKAEIEWAEEFQDGFLAGIKFSEGIDASGIHVYEDKDGLLTLVLSSGGIHINAGDTVAFRVPEGTSYIILKGGKDRYIKLSISEPFGEPGMVMRVG